VIKITQEKLDIARKKVQESRRRSKKNILNGTKKKLKDLNKYTVRKLKMKKRKKGSAFNTRIFKDVF